MWLWNKILVYCVYGVFLGSFYTFDVASKRGVSNNVTFLILISFKCVLLLSTLWSRKFG